MENYKIIYDELIKIVNSFDHFPIDAPIIESIKRIIKLFSFEKKKEIEEFKCSICFSKDIKVHAMYNQFYDVIDEIGDERGYYCFKCEEYYEDFPLIEEKIIGV